MRRNTGCLIGALLPITALVILVYGFHPWFRHRITTKKLTKPNPTSFVFKASVDEIQTVLKKKAVQCCGKVIEFKGYAPFSASILGSPGNENDAYIHNFHEPIGPSAVYFSGENPLPYLCEFHLHMIPVSKGVTRVVVVAYEPEVLDGQSWWGPHNFSPANMYKDVAPTTIEEYRILLELGSALGADNMPPLLISTASGKT
jgi:hypothetical protein